MKKNSKEVVFEVLQGNGDLSRSLSKDFLTAAEVAEKLSLSVHTIRKWRAQRVIPCRKFGRSVRYRLDDVLKSMSK